MGIYRSVLVPFTVGSFMLLSAGGAISADKNPVPLEHADTKKAKEEKKGMRDGLEEAVPSVTQTPAPVSSPPVAAVSAEKTPVLKADSGMSLFKRLFSGKDDRASDAPAKPKAIPSSESAAKKTESKDAVKKAGDEKPQPAIPAGGSVSKVSNSGVTGRGVVDVYLTINNSSKAEDAIIGGEAQGANLVLVTVIDEKEVEGAVAVPLKAEDSAVFKSGKQFLRLTAGDKKLKVGDKIGVSLYFRRSANANFTVIVGE